MAVAIPYGFPWMQPHLFCQFVIQSVIYSTAVTLCGGFLSSKVKVTNCQILDYQWKASYGLMFEVISLEVKHLKAIHLTFSKLIFSDLIEPRALTCDDVMCTTSCICDIQQPYNKLVIFTRHND